MESDSIGMIGAGLVHGWAREADGTIHDLYAIMSGSGDTAFDSVDIPGDDEIKGTFNSNQKLEGTISANAFSFAAYEAISGNPVTFVAAVSGNPAHRHVAGGTLSENNSPYVEIGLVTQGKDDLGNDGHYVRILHRVQCKPTRSPQENNTELKMEFDYTAYPTATSIIGTALTSRRIDTKYFIDGPFDIESAILFPEAP